MGFAGLTDAIDALGGVDIEVDESEISHLNNYACKNHIEHHNRYNQNNDFYNKKNNPPALFLRLRLLSGFLFPGALPAGRLLPGSPPSIRTRGTVSWFPYTVIPT